MKLSSKATSFFKNVVSKFCGLKTGVKVILAIFLSIVLIVTSAKITEFIGYVKLDSKTELTVEEMKDAVKKIYRKNMGFASSILVAFSDEKKRFIAMPGYDIISKMTGDQFVINSTGGDSFSKRHFEPTEIAATFECYLYFEGKKIPGTILGITNAQSSGGVDNINPNLSFVSVADYEELCEQIDVSGMSRQKAAKKLAKAWIEKYNYVKR